MCVCQTAQDVSVVVQPPSLLVPVHQYDMAPTYYIFAGLVFVPLSQPYLQEWGDDWYNSCPRKLCDRAMHGDKHHRDQQAVVLSQSTHGAERFSSSSSTSVPLCCSLLVCF